MCTVVVADDCSDNTAAIARHAFKEFGIRNGIVLQGRYRNVGKARAVGSTAALRVMRDAAPAHRIWLANTDADSCVPSWWLGQHIGLAQRGFDVVAGVVDIDSFDEFPPGFEDSFYESYGIETSGTHGHVQATNFGVSALAYESVGGWPTVQRGEDRQLWDRLQRAGFTAISDSSVRVLTSGRAVGRVSGGFADSLRLLAAQTMEVAS
jgi:Glycosyl transferase family 2